MENYMLSTHLVQDRAGRLAKLQEYLGYSDRVMIEAIDRDGHARVRILSTGIMLILDLYEDFVITAYMATFSQALAIYKQAGKNRMPEQLKKRLIKNAERHPELFTMKW